MKKVPRSWDYDGKEFYVIEDGVQRFYKVPSEVKEQLKQLTDDHRSLEHYQQAMRDLLYAAKTEGRLGLSTQERNV